MALAGTIVVGIVLVIGALNGLRRGAVKEGMALVGVLLGGLLVTLWMERWGLVVSRRTGWQPGTGQWLAAMVTLWATALLAGYGSGVLFPKKMIRVSSALRVGGAALGVVNAGLLLGLTLRYTQSLLYGETGTARRATWIRGAAASSFLLDRFDLIVLGIAWTIAVLSLVVTLIHLVRRLFSSPQPTARPAAPAQPSPASRPSSDAPLVIGGTTPATTVRPPGKEPSFIEKPRPPAAGGS